jgi:2-polyprenyl-3-methyl-5-hydroxy-6-metoxy-1,4-benzoquinol methylase
MRREKKRDDRDYDTTQLHASGHGKNLGRDYSAHFFRWSFARRFIGTTDNVLEIGCGQDKPLSKILTGGASARVNKYIGVDLNKIKPSESQRLTFLGEFNFVERYKELLKGEFKEGFDIVVHLEVIEHMKVEHGTKLLKACFEALKPSGIMLMSTPCYDGKRHAANHIHEYEVIELHKATARAGFLVEQRFGTFMDIKHIGKVDISMAGAGVEIDGAISTVKKLLERYYDNDAISCIFAPLYPDHARNNLWVCRKPIKSVKGVISGGKQTGKLFQQKLDLIGTESGRIKNVKSNSVEIERSKPITGSKYKLNAKGEPF